MRPFEILLTLASVTWLIRFAAVTRPESPWCLLSLQILLGILLALQILLEGWRPHLFPVYAVAILAASGAPVALCSDATVRLCCTAIGLVMTGASLFGTLLLPHLSIPCPS